MTPTASIDPRGAPLSYHAVPDHVWTPGCLIEPVCLPSGEDPAAPWMLGPDEGYGGFRHRGLHSQTPGCAKPPACRPVHAMSGQVCFVDTETTGITPEAGEVYEVGLIMPGGGEHEWWLLVDGSKADPIALSIGRFHDRHPHGNGGPTGGKVTAPHVFAREFSQLTHGLHLAGAVVSFDERRLWDLLRGQGVTPSWHYHIIDVEALAAGWLARDPDSAPLLPPWDSNVLSLAVGVDPKDFDSHTALADARWAKAIYEAVLG